MLFALSHQSLSCWIWMERNFWCWERLVILLLNYWSKLLHHLTNRKQGGKPSLNRLNLDIDGKTYFPKCTKFHLSERRQIKQLVLSTQSKHSGRDIHSWKSFISPNPTGCLLIPLGKLNPKRSKSLKPFIASKILYKAVTWIAALDFRVHFLFKSGSL